jgi:hypothetical protein
MQRIVALTVFLLCSCSTAPYQLGSNPNAVLLGVPGNTACATSDPYSGTLAILNLTEPVSFGSVRDANYVELIMPERYHVQYGRYTGKPVRVTCELTESGLCGYPQIACAVVEMRVEP